MTADPPWPAWAPPLDPPTPGGLPAGQAEAIAAGYWDDDPHLCAALMWESYAATLVPTPSVSSVQTGAQSVAYRPAMPAGEYGLAVARAQWHRSFCDSVVSVPLLVHVPAGLRLQLARREHHAQLHGTRRCSGRCAAAADRAGRVAATPSWRLSLALSTSYAPSPVAPLATNSPVGGCLFSGPHMARRTTTVTPKTGSAEKWGPWRARAARPAARRCASARSAVRSPPPIRAGVVPGFTARRRAGGSTGAPWRRSGPRRRRRPQARSSGR